MLNFCPFDFFNIDMNNLAYELVFPRGWDWDRVKRETVVGSQKRRFISENDTRREKYSGTTSTVEHVILLETMKKGGKNGFELFKELIAHNNKSNISASDIENDIEDEDLRSYGIESGSAEDSFDDSGFGDDGPIKLNFEIRNGIATFVDLDGSEVMYAMPCCPKCHCRLPIGWDVADDFGGISLMGPTGGGKTTFLYSMMNNNWAVFRNLGLLNGENLSITSAHRAFDKTDTSYYHMTEQAEEQCKDNGKCPNPTPPSHWIPPVFLNIKYGINDETGKPYTLILGIYDNAGENLMQPNPQLNPNLNMVLDKMFADIFLFDPMHMNIVLPQQVDSNEGISCEVLSIEEQGNYQIEHHGESINAQDLIKKTRKNIRVLDVYNNLLAVRQQYDVLHVMHDMHFLGVIIKSDLLEKCDDISGNDDYSLLFDRDNQNDMLNIDRMAARSDLVKEMIEELHLLGEKKVESFQNEYGKAISWHCVSALGCDASMNGELLGEYNPIRVAEPIITCILWRISENGWMR